MDKNKLRTELNPTHVLASALAAVSAALAASYLGVIGTVVGAGIFSLIATVGTALYRHSLEKANVAVRQVGPVNRKELGENPSSATEVDPPPATRPADQYAAPHPKLHWGQLGATVVLVFFLTVGALTTVEWLSGGSLSSLLRSGPGNGTNVIEVYRQWGHDSTDTQNSPAPTHTETVTSDSEQSTESKPAPSPEPEPTPVPTESSPSSPSPTPTTTLSPTPSPSPSPTPTETPS